jgi:DNA-binding beta-propeller fold protein YncE
MLKSDDRARIRCIGLSAALFAFFGIWPVVSLAMMPRVHPFKSVGEIVIPDVPWGPYADHLAVDPARHLLYVTPQAAHEVAILSLTSDKVVRVIHGIKNPHSVFYSQRYNRLIVTDGGSGDIKIFNAADLSLERTISAPGADGLTSDRRDGLVFVTYGGSDVKQRHSDIAIVSVRTGEMVGNIQISADDLESPLFDPVNGRLYVELPNNDATAVINVKQRKVISVWPLKMGRHPFASAIDARRDLLFVGTRDTDMTGTVFVVSLRTGRLVTSARIGSWVDSMSFDSMRRRLYLSTGVGFLDAFGVNNRNQLARLPQTPTAVMAKTSLFSQTLDLMFVMVPHLGDTPAKVLVFRPIGK